MAITDMLDEFSATKIDSNEKVPKASGPGRPSAGDIPKDPLGIEGLTDDDFAKQLQAGMADLLGEMQNNVSITYESSYSLTESHLA
jgi:peroxin-19